MLSIIVSHYKSPILLKLCLQSIKENVTFSDYEIIVADSEAQSNTREMLEDYFKTWLSEQAKEGQIRYLPFAENLGYAKIVNRAIKRARGEYFLVINADIIVLKHATKRLMDYLKENPDVGVVAPSLLTFSNQGQISAFHHPNLKAFLARRTVLGKTEWGKRVLTQFQIPISDKEAQEVDWVQGSAMMVKKDAVNKVGLLDERFFMYLEDADWCRRFWKNDYRVVYLPFAQMSHYYHRKSKRWGQLLDPFLNKATRWHIRSAFKYFWKWRGTA